MQIKPAKPLAKVGDGKQWVVMTEARSVAGIARKAVSIGGAAMERSMSGAVGRRTLRTALRRFRRGAAWTVGRQRNLFIMFVTFGGRLQLHGVFRIPATGLRCIGVADVLAGILDRSPAVST